MASASCWQLVTRSGHSTQRTKDRNRTPPGTWATAGITTRAQTFDPRRVAIDSTASISSFRTRQYDPATGTWLQEDHAGLAGGINLYQYNGNDPNSFSDPFGVCPKDAGGDGKTDSFEDCPTLSSGWFANRANSSKGSALINNVGGVISSCFESEKCVGVGLLLIPGGSAGLTVEDAEESSPLLGNNPQPGSGSNPRINTDLPGGSATAKSIFRNMTKGTEIEQTTARGTIRRTASNGITIRFNQDGSVRLDLPRGPTGSETIHFNP
jgi:RHS repeat-associated protein